MAISNETAAANCRAILKQLIRTDGTVDHKAFLNEMERRSLEAYGRTLTLRQYRLLARIVKAYEAEHRHAMHCDRCEMVSINGVACHERGCPNMGARWDGEIWIKQRECFECGCTVDADDPCCNGDES
jgi:hypothetical protein